MRKLKIIFPILFCAAAAVSDTGFRDMIQVTETDGSPKCMAGQIKFGEGQIACSGNTATVTITGGAGGGGSALETIFGTTRSSPTATLKGTFGDFTGSVTGSTMTITLSTGVARLDRNQAWPGVQTFVASTTFNNLARHRLDSNSDIVVGGYDTGYSGYAGYISLLETGGNPFGWFDISASSFTHPDTMSQRVGPRLRLTPDENEGTFAFDSGKRFLLLGSDGLQLGSITSGVTATPMKFFDDNFSNYTAIIASGTIDSDATFRLPTAYGTAGQVLHSDGTGGLYFDTDDSGGGSGGGYAVEPATVTFNLAKGVLASTATVSSTATIAGTQFYTHTNSEPAYQNFTTSAAVITTTMNLMPRDTQGVCPLNIWDNSGQLATAVSVAGEWDINRAIRINSTANSTTPEAGTKNGIAFNNYSTTPGNFVSIHLNNAVGGDSAGLYMVNVTTAGQYGGPVQRQGRMLFYTGTEADGFNAERLRIDEYGRLMSPSFIATSTSMTVTGAGGLTVSSLGSQSCVGTDSNGKFQAGTCTGGGGDNLGNHVATMTLTAPFSIVASSINVSSNTIMSGATFYHNAPAVFGTAPKLASLTSQDCLGTSADGTIQAGTCSSGPGGAVLSHSTRTITFSYGSGGDAALDAGSTHYVYVPYAATIKDWTIISESTGSVVIDVKKCAGFNCNPTSSIAASAKPTLSNAWANQDTTLTGWTTSVAAGDKIAFVIDSASTLTRVNLVLKVWVSQIP